MKKIKIIKRDDPRASTSPSKEIAKTVRPKKQRSIESTIQSWLTERREEKDAEENRFRNSDLAVWNSDPIPSEAV